MRSQPPAVSIIIPTYNRASVLGRSLQSLVVQTFRDVEIIVIDDGSTDETAAVIKAYTDPPVSYVRFNHNHGAAAARNEGIRRARGSYIAFQDSDDVWHPQKLEKQMALFSNAPEKIGVVYTGLQRVDGTKTFLVPDQSLSHKEGDLATALVQGNFIPLPATVVRKECFSAAGLFDEALPCLQDWELWLRISQQYHFRYLTEPLVTSYFSSDSICRDKRKLIVALEYILNKHPNLFYRAVRIPMYKYLAYLNFSCDQLPQSRKYLLKVLREAPANTDGLYLLVLLLLAPKKYRQHTELLYNR